MIIFSYGQKKCGKGVLFNFLFLLYVNIIAKSQHHIELKS